MPDTIPTWKSITELPRWSALKPEQREKVRGDWLQALYREGKDKGVPLTGNDIREVGKKIGFAGDAGSFAMPSVGEVAQKAEEVFADRSRDMTAVAMDTQIDPDAALKTIGQKVPQPEPSPYTAPQKILAPIGAGFANVPKTVQQGIDTVDYWFYRPVDKLLGTNLSKQFADRLARTQAAKQENAQVASEAGGSVWGPVASQLAEQGLIATAQVLTGSAVASTAATIEQGISRAMAASASIGGLQSASATFAERVKRGVDNGEDPQKSADKAIIPSVTAGLATAVITKAFGATGIQSVYRQAGPRGVVNRIVQVLKDAGMEGAEESADELFQVFNDNMTGSPQSLADAAKRTVMAFTLGGILGGGFSGVNQVSEARADTGQQGPIPVDPDTIIDKTGEAPVAEPTPIPAAPVEAPAIQPEPAPVEPVAEAPQAEVKPAAEIIAEPVAEKTPTSTPPTPKESLTVEKATRAQQAAGIRKELRKGKDVAPNVEQQAESPKTSEPEPSTPEWSSVKNAWTEAVRQSRNYGERSYLEGRGTEQVYENVLSKLKKDPSAHRQLESELRDNMRPVTDDETAMLSIRGRELENEIQTLETRKIELQKANADTTWIDAMLAKKQAEQVEFFDVVEGIGQMQSVAFSARYRFQLMPDMTLAKLEREFTAAKERPPTTEESAAMAEQVAKNKELESKITELEKQNAELRARDIGQEEFDALKEANKKVQKQPSAKSVEIAKKVVDFLETKESDAWARIKERRRQGRAYSGIDPEAVADYAVIVASRLAKGTYNAAKFIAEAGEAIKPYIGMIEEKARKELETVRKSIKPATEREAVSRWVQKAIADKKEDADTLPPAVRKLAKTYIEEGVVKYDEMLDKVLADLKPIYPDLTLKDVSEAFSDYGKPKMPKKDAVSRQIIEWRAQGQKLGAILDAMTGTMPKKSGAQRTEPSTQVRQLKQELEYVMKQLDIKSIDQASKDRWLKNRLDAIKKRIGNEIKDREKAIATKVSIDRGTNKPTVLDAEAIAMKEKLEDVRKRYEEVFKEADKKAESKLQDQIGILEDKIARKDFEPPPKKERREITQKIFDLKQKRAKLQWDITWNRLDRISKMWYGLQEVGRMLRMLSAGGDLSYVFRQFRPTVLARDIGSTATGKPSNIWGKAAVAQIKAYASEEKYNAIMEELRKSPYTNEARKYGLWNDLQPLNVKDRPESALTSRLDKWPLMARGNRAATVGNNVVVDLLYRTVAPQMEAAGRLKTEADHRRLASFIGDMAHRAVMPKSNNLQQIIRATSDFLFSSRFLISTVKNTTTLFHTINTDPTIRKEGAKTLAGFAATAIAAVAIANSLRDEKDKVDLDPVSPDFMKIKIGNTRFDIIANYGPLVRFIAQMATGETKDAKGKTKEADRERVLMQFIKSKRSPLVGIMMEAVTGKKYSGQKIEGVSGWLQVALDHVIYMWLADAIDAYRDVSKKSGTADALTWGALAGGSSFIGEGVQTYDRKQQKKKSN